MVRSADAVVRRPASVARELFGVCGTGINFDKYEDIPVVASGEDAPPHIENVRVCRPLRDARNSARWQSVAGQLLCKAMIVR